MVSPRLVEILKDALPLIDGYLKQAAEAFKLNNEDRGRWCIAQVETTIIGIANCVENGLAWEIFKSAQPDYERAWSSIKNRIQTEPNFGERPILERALVGSSTQDLTVTILTSLRKNGKAQATGVVLPDWNHSW